MGHVLEFDPSSSFEEMVTFVMKGKGVSLAAFANSAKNLQDLFKEVTRREITLILDSDGFIKRKVRNVKIIIKDEQRDRIWIEIAREYPNGKIVHKERDYALRETCRVAENEKPFDTATRALKEELKYFLGTTERPLFLLPMSIGPVSEEYPSSVYPGIKTSAISTWYQLAVDQFLSEESYKVKKDDADSDGDPNAWVEIHLLAVPSENREREPV